MTAYNFQTRFVSPIEQNLKPHTIRAPGKRTHAKAGDKMQLYTGMRTKYCRLVKEVTCIGNWELHCPVIIQNGPLYWSLDGQRLSSQEQWQLALNDGFADLFEMAEFILVLYGGDARLRLIAWAWETAAGPCTYLPGHPFAVIDEHPPERIDLAPDGVLPF